MAAHGYSVRGLARELGYAPSSVERWRAGEWPVPRAVELALEALGRRAT